LIAGTPPRPAWLSQPPRTARQPPLELLGYPPQTAWKPRLVRLARLAALLVARYTRSCGACVVGLRRTSRPFQSHPCRLVRQSVRVGL